MNSQKFNSIPKFNDFENISKIERFNFKHFARLIMKNQTGNFQLLSASGSGIGQPYTTESISSEIISIQNFRPLP